MIFMIQGGETVLERDGADAEQKPGKTSGGEGGEGETKVEPLLLGQCESVRDIGSP